MMSLFFVQKGKYLFRIKWVYYVKGMENNKGQRIMEVFKAIICCPSIKRVFKNCGKGSRVNVWSEGATE